MNSGKEVTRGWSQTIPSCNHEESNSRMVIHLLDALQQGLSTCLDGTVHRDPSWQKAKVVLPFQALSGSDTVSAF